MLVTFFVNGFSFFTASWLVVGDAQTREKDVSHFLFRWLSDPKEINPFTAIRMKAKISWLSKEHTTTTTTTTTLSFFSVSF
jgi:hypothetical protein